MNIYTASRLPTISTERGCQNLVEKTPLLGTVAAPVRPLFGASAASEKSIEWMTGVLDSNAEFAGGGRQAPIERDERRIEASGDREMEGVRRSEPQIEAPDIDIGEPSIGRRDVDRRAHRRAPSIEVRQTGRCVGVSEQGHAYQARKGRCDFGGGKITDKQFPTIGAETVVNSFGGRLSDQRREEDTSIQIGTQSSFDS